MKLIKVLIVEDSVVVQKNLAYILESDPAIKVIGTASNGRQAIEFLKQNRPDVITMDIVMPVMDGIEATGKIMKASPVPIVMVSANWRPEEVEKTFEAMEAGAVSVIEKPQGIGHPDYERQAGNLINTVRLMSEVKVVKRWSRPRQQQAVADIQPADKYEAEKDISLVAIGASTGGPPVLQTILSGLPADFPAPVLVVQHIVPGFVLGMAEWLSHITGKPVHLAQQGAYLQPGHVYLAPDGFHMGVKDSSHVYLSRHPMENGLRPSVSYLFRSVANVFGRKAAGVLLTGMGRDGAEELKLMREKGAVTIAQDKESSVVYGMPGEAVHLGAAMYVLPPERIAQTLASLVAVNGLRTNRV